MKSVPEKTTLSTAESSLRGRKQQVVRSALYDAAIDLFAVKGFDETTVEEVAQTAGVSRRSFFRYFSSKDDLLAQSVISYGRELANAVERCPPGLSPLRVVEETMLAGVAYTSRPASRTREVVTIAAGSRLARQAHISRILETEDLLAGAFADYFQNAPAGTVQPRMLAGITLSLMGAVILSWFKGEYADLPASAQHIFRSFSGMLGQTPRTLPKVKASLSSETSSKRSKPLKIVGKAKLKN
jgi:AcrR family transcriptional regulator